MSLPGLKAADVSVPMTDLDRLKRTEGKTLEGEKARLREASRQFEAFFMHQMLKTMRKTIPEDPLAEDQLLNNESGQEIYTDLFDMELARKVATGGTGSISDILYRSMESLVEARFAEQQTEESDDVGSLRSEEQEPIPLDNNRFSVVSRRPSIPLEDETRSSVRVSENNDSLPADTISMRFGREINAASQRHGVDATLIHSVIKAESSGDPEAVSSAGAGGLMQLIDSTAAQYKVEDVFDAQQNIEGGTEYLKSLIDRFGDLRLALAAYNAGPGNVEKHGGIPPFPETEAYVNKVLNDYTDARRGLRTAETKEAGGEGR